MGGTDDPSNLIELTIEEHAEAHRILWEKHNLIEDKIAWQCLSGRKMSEQDRILLSTAGFKKFMSDPTKKEKWRQSVKESTKNKMDEIVLDPVKYEVLKKLTKEGRESFLSDPIRYNTWITNLKDTANKPFSIEVQRKNYLKNNMAEVLAEGRRKSAVWKQSVSSEKCRNKKRLSDPRSRKVYVYGTVYDSIRHAAKESHISYSKLRNILHVNSNNNITFC